MNRPAVKGEIFINPGHNRGSPELPHGRFVKRPYEGPFEATILYIV